MNKIQVMVTDNYKLNRESWAFILNSDPRFQVVGECAETDDVMQLATEKRPDVILININMPLSKRLQSIVDIRRRCPSSNIIGISPNPLPGYAKKMMQRGAKGYVTRNSSKEEVFLAIVEVAHGNKYICEEVRNIFYDQLLLDDKQEKPAKEISIREMEIIELIKTGQSSKEIAGELHISLRTVEVHRHNILKKLNLKNTVSLINYVNSSLILE